MLRASSTSVYSRLHKRRNPLILYGGKGEQDETHKLPFHRRGSSGPERCNCNEQHARSVPSRLCCALVPRCVRSWAGAVVARAVVRLWCTDAAAVSRRRVRCFLFPLVALCFCVHPFFPSPYLVPCTGNHHADGRKSIWALLAAGVRWRSRRPRLMPMVRAGAGFFPVLCLRMQRCS